MNKSIFLAFFGLVCLTASLTVFAFAKRSTPQQSPASAYTLLVGESDMSTGPSTVEHYIVKMDVATGKAWYLCIDSNHGNERTWFPIKSN